MTETDKALKVIVVDDSTVFRSQTRAALGTLPWVQLVGHAGDGKMALDLVGSVSVDVLVLDLEMPVMNGLEVLTELKRRGSTLKVVVFSAHTKSGAENTLAALSAGASDFLTKPSLDASSKQTPAEAIRAVLVPKLEQFRKSAPAAAAAVAAPATRSPRAPATAASAVTSVTGAGSAGWSTFLPSVVVIASSTGGPNALEKLFSLISPPVMCPILLVQHMPPIFTATLAERLSKLSGIPVAEAKSGAPLVSGQAHMAPGDFHLRVAKRGAQMITTLDQDPQRNSVRPAADFLFEAAAEIYGPRCLGIVLTGMGADGKDGAQAIKRSLGKIVIQSKESCVVFGMPGAVFEAGAYDDIGDIEAIAARLVQLGVCARKREAA